MKNISRILILVFTWISFQTVSAQARKPADVESSVSALSTVTAQNIKDKSNDIFHAVDAFVTFHRLSEKDLNSVILVLKTLALADTQDDFDPPRDTAYSLSDSYLKNKSIYKKAFEKLTKKEKQMWSEVFKEMETRARSKTKGNG